jgi:hypothetical protein
LTKTKLIPTYRTTHGTPTRKKENRKSRGKRKNEKKKPATTTYIRSMHAEKKWTTPKEGRRLNKNKSFKDEKF